MKLLLENKVFGYSIAEDDDIGAERFQQVRDGKLWRGWIGTIYGSKVASENVVYCDTRDMAVKNARLVRDNCREIIAKAAPKKPGA